jgi:hypothetical protein
MDRVDVIFEVRSPLPPKGDRNLAVMEMVLLVKPVNGFEVGDSPKVFDVSSD